MFVRSNSISFIFSADIDPLRLYITGFGKDTTVADLQKIFPRAVEITLPIRKKDHLPLGYAIFMHFVTRLLKPPH